MCFDSWLRIFELVTVVLVHVKFEQMWHDVERGSRICFFHSCDVAQLMCYWPVVIEELNICFTGCFICTCMHARNTPHHHKSCQNLSSVYNLRPFNSPTQYLFWPSLHIHTPPLFQLELETKRLALGEHALVSGFWEHWTIQAKLKSALTCTVRSQCTPAPDRWTSWQ